MSFLGAISFITGKVNPPFPSLRVTSPALLGIRRGTGLVGKDTQMAQRSYQGSPAPNPAV